MQTKPASHDDDLIRVSDAAALIGISVDTLKRWTAAGRVAAVRTPTNHRRYRRADILALVTPDPAALADAEGGAR